MKIKVSTGTIIPPPPIPNKPAKRPVKAPRIRNEIRKKISIVEI
jgi:hypothetical protein